MLIDVKVGSYRKHLLEAVLALAFLLFFCEYLIYYVVLIQCGWPSLEPHKVDQTIAHPKTEETPVHAMFIADTHLLGSRNGHWFDKLRREWQMYRTFQTMITIHKPDLVFILGDVFDEGLWCSSTEFEQYISRFRSLFNVPENTHLYVVAGNHDMGFHYGIITLKKEQVSDITICLAITPYLNQRFINGLKTPSVRRISIRGNHFILINSMALEGDGCFLCRPTEVALKKIAKHLKCAKDMSSDCGKTNAISRYSRPILLQHYPMYRESDEICNEIDQAPEELKYIKFRERWECLSKESSEQLLDILNPRLIVDGHTHHGCRKIHREDILEFTISSFNWRNKDNPSLLLGVFTPNNYAVSKCYMLVESTVIRIYGGGIVCITVYLIIKFRQKRSRHFLKLH